MSKETWMIALLAATLAAGCALVTLTPEGAMVGLSKPDAVASCEKLGRVTASVVARAGFAERLPEVVQEDLNVVARNSAATMGADTIVPVTPVRDGKQTFDTYRCTRR